MALKAKTTIKVTALEVRQNADEDGNPTPGGIVCADVVIEGPGGTLRSSETIAFDADPLDADAVSAIISGRMG